MAFRAWICETCRHPQKFRDNIWDCPGCGSEGCDDCFDRYAHCKACGAGKADEELRLAANAKGFDFDPEPEPTCLWCESGFPQLRLQSGTGNFWHRNESGQLYKCTQRPQAADAVDPSEDFSSGKPSTRA